MKDSVCYISSLNSLNEVIENCLGEQKNAETPTYLKIVSNRFRQCYDNEYIVTSLDISNRLLVFELGFHPQKFNFHIKNTLFERN